MRYGLLFAALTVFGLLACGVQAAEPEFLKYEDFLQKVQEDKVKSLTLGPLNYLEGTYVQGEVGTEFFTQHPLEPGNDPLLSKLLESHQVSVVKREPRQAGTMELIGFILQRQFTTVILAGLVVFVLIYVVKINNKIDRLVIR